MTRHLPYRGAPRRDVRVDVLVVSEDVVRVVALLDGDKPVPVESVRGGDREDESAAYALAAVDTARNRLVLRDYSALVKAQLPGHRSRAAAVFSVAWLLIVAGTAWLVLKTVRTELTAGPGWFSTQGLLRRRYVRSDQLRRVTCGRSGIDRIIILTDRDGRRVGVLLNRLQHNPELRRRIAADVRVSVRGGLVLSDRCARLLRV